jgi:hypothetical protein
MVLLGICGWRRSAPPAFSVESRSSAMGQAPDQIGNVVSLRLDTTGTGPSTAYQASSWSQSTSRQRIISGQARHVFEIARMGRGTGAAVGRPKRRTPLTHEDAMKQNTTRLNLEQLETRFVLSTISPIHAPEVQNPQCSSWSWGASNSYDHAPTVEHALRLRRIVS